MSAAMPRDSLGRIVYVGDVTTCGAMVYLANSADLRMMSQGTFFDAEADKLVIDLAASPYRTNYERYFADLGTFDEVIDAYEEEPESICADACPTCPFAFLAGGDCYYFQKWLNEKAVV